MTESKNLVLLADNPMTLGVQFLMSHLQEAEGARGWNPTGLLCGGSSPDDCRHPFSENEKETLAKFLLAKKPDVVGVSTIERSRGRVLPFMAEMRHALPDSIFVAGGVDASNEPSAYLEQGIDLVVRGDGETAMTGLLQQLKHHSLGEIDLPQGVIPSHGNEVVAAPPPQTLPLPYVGPDLFRLIGEEIRSVADSETSASHVQFKSRKSALDMFTQKGCTHKCRFCAQDLLSIYHNDPWRNSIRRPLADIVDHLAKLKAALPSKDYVYFWDLDFLRRPREELAAFALSYKKRVGLPFFIFVTEKSVISRGAHVIEQLADAGLSTINMGIQSGSERILEMYGRNNTPQEALEATKTIHKALDGRDVEVLYDIITFNPRETNEDLRQTIELLLEIPHSESLKTKICTHRLSFNTGQGMALETDRRTSKDYQDILGSNEYLQEMQAPFLTWLLGNMMRGEITQQRIGSVERSQINELIRNRNVRNMDALYGSLEPLYLALLPCA